MKAIIDKFLGLAISKKLTVFIIATVLMFGNHLTSNDWVDISLMYIGTQGVIDLIKQIRK